MTKYFVLHVLVIYRLIGVVLVQTSFVPDEYWQSLEVSHNLMFGYGYLTWEWKKHIRSCVYPNMIASLYYFLPDSRAVMIQAPRMFQAILSAVGDYYTFKLSSKLFGNMAGMWTIYCLISSWFLFYCSSRTLTNMAETSFTACGLYFYHWPKEQRQNGLQLNYLWFVGLSVMMRPTAIILWIPLYLWHAWRERHNIVILIVKTSFIGIFMFSMLIIIDSICYGQPVITPYQFFLFNWTNDIGSFYGTHPWHWYFTIGFPTVMTTHLIPFVLGLSSTKIKTVIYLLILWYVVILSFPSHKEIRFLLPIMPLSMCVCGSALDRLYSNRMKLWKWKLNPRVMFFITVFIMSNAPLVYYTGSVHQRGTLDAVKFLSESVTDNSSVLFLMPCHSTPYYSHIHKNITMKFLTCEPNFEKDVNYMDEAEQFYKSPKDWLDSYFISNDSVNSSQSTDGKELLNKIPSHIVIFDKLYISVSEFLNKFNYKICFSAKHTDFMSGRVGKYIHVYCTSV